MKKELLILCIALSVLASCSKKTHPAISNSPKKADTPIIITQAEPATINPETLPPAVLPPPVAATMLVPLIVIDEKGEIITSRDKLPGDIGTKVDYKKIARSFTPAQRQNLIYRFKMIPPRVLFVPDKLASKTARGYYVVYKKKFWYWKKEDGLFYLDETYYQ